VISSFLIQACPQKIQNDLSADSYRGINRHIMVISYRLRAIREQKDLSQGDIEQRTGLKRCYVSRVENGHTVPSIETLEKLARALEVPMYQLFYEGEQPPEVPSLPKGISAGNVEWGSSGESAKFFNRLHQLLSRLSADDRKLIMHMTFQLVRKNRP